MKKTTAIIILLIFIIIVACGCGDRGDTGGVNDEALTKLIGDYDVSVEESFDKNVGEWWHLSIIDNDEYGKCLSIYDAQAGNPGVEGTITFLDDSTMEIAIDPDYYDDLPTYEWECDGKTLLLEYVRTDDGIELTNKGTTIKFTEEK